MKFDLTAIIFNIKNFLLEHLKKVTADTLGWLTAIVLHCATLPSLLAIISGLSDRMPELEMVLFVWTGLSLLFARAIILRDRLNTVTIGTGFIGQAVLLALIMFK